MSSIGQQQRSSRYATHSAERPLRLSNQETHLAPHHLLTHLHVVDVGERRTYAAPRDHLLDGLSGAFEDCLNGAVRAISHPAGDTAGHRLGPTAIPIPDVVNKTAHDHPPPLPSFRGVHGVKVPSPVIVLAGTLTIEVDGVCPRHGGGASA